MVHHYWSLFAEVIATPFRQLESVWGIVPLYFGLLLNEMTSAKASFRTAVQTGFGFVWAAAQWIYPYLQWQGGAQVELKAMSAINLVVTLLVLSFGFTALICGLMKRFPAWARFLGYTRFANYFMIAIFPMQSPIPASHLPWTWERLLTITLFAVPIWFALHFGLMPVRNRK